MPHEQDDVAPETQRVGRIVGQRYRIERAIGQGGMGAVFQARELGSGQRVALKVLRDYARFNSQILERFLQESMASALIHHPNVVRGLGAFHDEVEGPVLVLEYLEGENLADHLTQAGVLPPGRALTIALEIARGVAAAHARGVIHRDLKPANVFLERMPGDLEPRVRVLDFGIALLREYRNAASREALIGTLNYMAPEQILTPGASDERTDVYSLGMTLYEMLAGETPFESASQTVILHDILNLHITPLSERCPHLPAAITSVVARALESEPAARFPSMNAFAEVLEALLREHA